MKKVAIHLPKKLLAKPPAFYQKLAAALGETGREVAFRQRQSLVAGADYEAGVFHFAHQAFVRQDNVLNTGLAYMYPFWYADPAGVFGDSSLAEAEFVAKDIPMQPARRFRNRLSKRLIENRKSKYPQREDIETFPDGAISVFLQGPSLPVRRAQFMSEIEMVASILKAAPDTPILVKPHPRTADPDTLAAVRAMARDHKNLIITDANIHDMLVASDLCCSISSSVALEAMVHHVPAVLFGTTDFHHCATTVTHPKKTAKALAKARATRWPYDRFLYWFLLQNCINMGNPDWFDRIQTRMAGPRA